MRRLGKLARQLGKLARRLRKLARRLGKLTVNSDMGAIRPDMELETIRSDLLQTSADFGRSTLTRVGDGTDSDGADGGLGRHGRC